MVAYYPFDVDARDASGNGNDGTPVGGISSTTGVRGGALEFNGVNGRVALPNNFLAAGLPQGTIACFVRVDSLDSSFGGVIINRGIAARSTSFLFGIAPNGKLGADLADQLPPQSLTPVPFNQFVHVAMTWNGTRCKYYLNGVLDGDFPFTETARDPFPGTRRVDIGVDDQNIGWFDGAIDDLRIYNRALPLGEIKQLVLRPVIVIPGIGGSFLDHPTKQSIWPGAVQTVLGTGPTRDLADLQFTTDGEPRTDTLSAGLEANNLLLGPIPFRVYPIDLLMDYLEDEGYQGSLFEFPYDFRKPIGALADALADKVQVVQNATGTDKVDIVAHSTGGLVAKQYLLNLGAGASAKVGTVVMIATPHLGAPKAMKALRYGDDLDGGVDACKLKRAAHNWPSLFSLLPGRKYVSDVGKYFEDLTDADNNGIKGLLGFDETVHFLKNGIESPEFCKMDLSDPLPRAALSPGLVDSHTVDFHDILDNWVKPSGVKVYAIAGYGKQTIVRLQEYGEKGKVRMVPLTSCLGDSTVPMKSAEGPSLSRDAVYYFDVGPRNLTHNKMLGDGDLHEQVLGLLQTGPGIHASGNSISATRPSLCTGATVITAHSPIRLNALDSLGRRTGFNADGTAVSEIPRSSTEVFGESQSLLLPEGDSYRILIEGTGAGTFALEQTDVDGEGDKLQSLRWEAIPVVSGALGALVTVFNAQQPILHFDTNGDGVTDYSLGPDLDGDRVPDILDLCPNTPLGSIVSASGCSIPQLVPCEGPEVGKAWKNHGEYVSRVAKVAAQFFQAGLLTESQVGAIVSQAARSDCGKKQR